MGVPAFYRWLADKYAKCVVDCLEDENKNPSEIDTSTPNPNGIEVRAARMRAHVWRASRARNAQPPRLTLAPHASRARSLIASTST